MSEPTVEELVAEADAIREVLKVLGPLSGPARSRVAGYVGQALGIAQLPPTGAPSVALAEPASVPFEPAAVASLPGLEMPTDIRTLREAKQPKSAVEMAAIVAYYLAEKAPEEERKATIGTADLEKYFKQANYPIPQKIGNVLNNAAASGYFDSASRGQYKLNPVGHNLVAHNLPAGMDGNATRRSQKRTTRSSRKPTKKATKTTVKKTAQRPRRSDRSVR